MKPSLRVTRDTLSPSLRRMAARVKDRRPILKTMGEYTVQHAKRAFNEPGLRPLSWPALHSGKPATLRKNSVLARSPRVVSVDDGKAVVGSDRKYSAIHQLGGKTAPRTIRPRKKKALAWPGGGPVAKVEHPGSKIPARPYFPFLPNGRPSPQFSRRLGEVARKRIDKLIGA